MSINIELIHLDNIKDVFDFEVENKEFFERTLPPRPEGYFNFNEFKNIMIEILEEQSRGECYMHIIRDQSGCVVGRINFHSVEGISHQEAELGYRIGELDQGKGYASEAVKLAAEKVFSDYGIKTIKAGTSTKNGGSQRVLEKNGFLLIGKEDKVMKVNGQWVNGLLYEKTSN